MNLKTFTILLALLLAVGVKAQTPGNAHPKREFRAAWIQTVNGQFKGMSTEADACWTTELFAGCRY